MRVPAYVSVICVVWMTAILLGHQTMARKRIVEMAEKQYPELAESGKNVQLPSQPSLQQIRSRRHDVTKLLDLLGVATQENVGSQFPEADVPRVLANLAPTTINQLSQSLPEYRINDVMRHLDLQVADRVKDLSHLSADIIQNLVDIGVPTFDIVNNITLLDRDALLQQLAVPTPLELVSRLNVDNAKEIVMSLNLKSPDDIKELMPFKDPISAFNFFGIPSSDHIATNLKLNYLKTYLDKIGKQFSAESMKENVRSLRESVLRELGVPSYNVVRHRMEHQLSPQNILGIMGIPSRDRIEKRLTQATGKTIAQRLLIPYRETVEANLALVSKDAILTKLDLPTVETILSNFRNLNRDVLLKMLGLPNETDLRTLLETFDPTKYVEDGLYLPDIDGFKEYVNDYEDFLIDAFGLPTDTELKHLLQDFDDKDTIIQQLDLLTPEKLRIKFRQLIDSDATFTSLNIPDRPVIAKALVKLHPDALVNELHLPLEQDLKDAVQIFAVKKVIRDTKLPTMEDLANRFVIPDYGRFIQNINLPSVHDLNDSFRRPEVRSTLQDIGIPRLQFLNTSVDNLGRDLANEIFAKLGIPTRDEWANKLPKLDAVALLRELNISTIEHMQSLLSDVDINTIMRDLVQPINSSLLELRKDLDIYKSLTKLGFPSSHDSLKSRITILNSDKFFYTLGIPDISELANILDVKNSEQLLRAAGFKSRKNMYKLLPFANMDALLSSIPTIDDIMNSLPIAHFKKHFDKLTNLPGDIRQQLLGMKDKLFEDIGAPEFMDLKNKLESAFDPDNLLKKVGLLSKEELTEVFQRYSREEILRRLNINITTTIEKTLDSIKKDKLISLLSGNSKQYMVKKMQIQRLEIVKSIGIPSKSEIGILLEAFQPEEGLKFLDMPSAEDIKKNLTHINVTDIVRILSIPSDDVLSSKLGITKSREFLQRINWPTKEVLHATIRNLSNHNIIFAEIGLPTMDEVIKELRLFKVDNVLEKLGLPDIDEILNLLQLSNATDVIPENNIITVERFDIPDIKITLKDIKWPSIRDIGNMLTTPDFTDALEELGGSTGSAWADAVKDIPVVEKALAFKDKYGDKISMAYNVVTTIKDIYDLLKDPNKLPDMGEKYGAKYGTKFGATIGSAFGPIGTVIGAYVGGIIGAKVGRFLGNVLCKVFCKRSDPPPDLVPPVVHCADIDTIFAPALQITADVTFSHPTASDAKYGDVSRTVRIDVMTSQFMPRLLGGKYYGSDVPESESFFRFHAWDNEKNHGWCDVTITVKVLRCPEPPMIDDGSYFRKSLLLGSPMAYYCNYAFVMDGEAMRLCGMVTGEDGGVGADWSGGEPQCKLAYCSIAPSVPDSTVMCVNDYYMSPCSLDGCAAYTRCVYTCRQGYEVPAGVRGTIVCLANGLWDDVPECQDVEAPAITSCPDSINHVVTDGTLGQSITWDAPRYHDNSGHVTVTQTVGMVSGSYFTEGVHQIAYTANDTAGNANRKCSFTVTVHVPRCPPLFPGAYQTDLNCTNDHNIHSACHFRCLPGFRLTGSHHAVCGIQSGDEAPSWMYHELALPVCKPEECKNLSTHENTELICSQWFLGSFCSASCAEGRAFTPSPPVMYACTFSVGDWLPHDVVPQCAPTTSPTGVVYRIEVTDTPPCTANSSNFEGNLHRNIEQTLLSSCDRCTVDGLDLTCIKVMERSKRDDTEGVVIDIRIQDAANTFPPKHAALTQRYSDMLDTVLSGVLARVGEYVTSHVTKTDVDDMTRRLIPELVCPAGYVSSAGYSTCVGCQKGTFYDSAKRSCESCERGTYQARYGQSDCVNCPPLQSTPVRGAESASECTDMCRVGQTSPTGVVPCVPCTVGTYQDAMGQISCHTCLAGHTTLGEGAVGVSKCLGVDLTFRPGQLNDSGLTFTHTAIQSSRDLSVTFWVRSESLSTMTILRAVAVDKVLLQIDMGPDAIYVRAFSSSDQLSAPLQDTRRQWVHVVVTYVSLTTQLTVYIDGVLRGVKVVGVRSAAVHSLANYTLFGGSSSADVHSLHMWSRALDNATISHLSGQCDLDLEGDYLSWSAVIDLPQSRPFIRYTSLCDDADDCGSSPCIHGACSDLLNDFLCTCKDGYTGKQCDVDINDCATHNCQNGGACRDGVATYTCECVSPYTGALCELTKVDGEWSKWTSWGECSRKCGGGRQKRHRQCDSPTPQNGGSWCEGHPVESEVCNNHSCPFCSPVDPPKNGLWLCEDVDDSAPDELSCIAVCLPGYKFTEVVPEGYRCGPSTGWIWTGQGTNRERSYVLPSCSLIEIPERLSTRVTITFPDLPCDSDQDAANANSAITYAIGEKAREIQCMNSGSCRQVQKTNCERGARRRRDTGPVVLDLTVGKDVVIPDVQLTDSGNGNELTELINQTVQNYADALAEVEEVAAKFTDFVTSSNFSVTVNDVEYTADAGNVTVVGVVTCPLGTAQQGSLCVACSPGTYDQDTFCVPCHVGTYQPEERQTHCIPCPDGMTTLERGAREVTQCDVYCEAGTYNSGNHCLPCDVGTFQPSFHRLSCIDCPSGYSTHTVGSVDASSCVAEISVDPVRTTKPVVSTFPVLTVVISCVLSLCLIAAVAITVWCYRHRHTSIWPLCAIGKASPTTVHKSVPVNCNNPGFVTYDGDY